MPRILTVSEVRKAIYLAAGGRESAGPGERTTALLGSLFHETFRILTGSNPAENLVRPLERADHNLSSWERQLIEHAYLWCIGPQLMRHQGELQNSTAEILNYWKAVQGLCKWLCEVLFNQSRPAQAIEELRRYIFAENEKECQAELSDPSWHDTISLQGRIDAILCQPGTGRLCAVELKLGQTSPEADLAQACLYHLLLTQIDASRAPKDLALLTFQPEEHTQVWTAAELEEAQTLLKDLIGRLGQVKGSKPSAVSPPPPREKALGDMARRILSGFEEFGAPIQFEGQPLKGPAFYRFLAKPARKIKADKILNMATTIWPRLRDAGVEQPPQIAMERGLITIDVQRQDRQIVHWKADLFQRPGIGAKAISRFPVGIDVEGNWKYADLAEPEHSHFLVAGTTGSGKTEWLKMVAGSLCTVNTPQTLTLVLIDPKRTAFSALADSPFLRRPIVYPSDENIPSVLDELIQEMEQRFSLFEGIQDLRQYNQTSPHPLPRIVCICDEYADLIMADSRKGKEIEQRVARIGAKGRSAGFHLILATQKPSRDVVKGVIKANLNARVALKVNERLESRIILEQAGAETLLGKGDLLFKDLGPATRLQSPIISDLHLKQSARC
jgi:DNA segregation ATPase FtsK/SpoIIIE, S-DNA-T family